MCMKLNCSLIVRRIVSSSFDKEINQFILNRIEYKVAVVIVVVFSFQKQKPIPHSFQLKSHLNRAHSGEEVHRRDVGTFPFTLVVLLEYADADTLIDGDEVQRWEDHFPIYVPCSQVQSYGYFHYVLLILFRSLEMKTSMYYESKEYIENPLSSQPLSGMPDVIVLEQLLA